MIYTSPTPPIEIPDVTLHDLVLERRRRARRAAGADRLRVTGRTITLSASSTCSPARLAAGPAGPRASSRVRWWGSLPPTCRSTPAAYFGRRTRRRYEHHGQRAVHRATSSATSCATSGARFLFTIGADARPRAAGGRGGRVSRRCSRSTVPRAPGAVGRRRCWATPTTWSRPGSTRRPRSWRCPTRAAPPASPRASCSPTETWSRTSLQMTSHVPIERGRRARGRAAVLPHLRPDRGHEHRPAVGAT